ncbi:MAG: thiolase family protein, partial [Planctomycetales bacterium]|nr:thiolase family protein [Planctomycetales bacterium]
PMREAVVVASSRTPLAKSFRGSFNITRPDDLLAHCLTDVLSKAPKLEPAEIEDLLVGCGFPEGPQGMNVARVAAIRAGLPTSIAAATVNRFCSSGLQAVAMAAHQILHEGADVALAGGVESITMTAQRPQDLNPWIVEHQPDLYMVMGVTAEVVAQRYQIGRQAQDEYALQSQLRTARAQQAGFFAEELAPIRVRRGLINKQTKQMDGEEEVLLEQDECNRPDTTLAGLSELPVVFDTKSGKGTVTAGNASQMSDGASACLLMSRQRALALGLQPKIAYRGLAVAGCQPDEMGIGPIYAVPKLLDRHGLKVSDIGLWELNEAFAVQVLYCQQVLGIDADKLNVNGGSIAIGHPYGMTGSRLVGTIANEMQRRGVRYGVVTMCIGGGQGAAGLFELCS